MNYLIRYFLPAFLILTSFSANALPIYIEEKSDLFNQLTITSVDAQDLTEQYAASSDDYIQMNLDNPKDLIPDLNPIDKVELIVDQIINIGQKIWTVVEKGRPISNYSNVKASALPANTTRWDQLSNWKTPKARVIGLVYKNVYGIEVVKFVYRIVLLYGGEVNGAGKYIGYASVEPVEITTAYMYTFNATAQVDSVFNMGSNKNPVAGMILNINWTIETVLKKTTQTHTYTLDGSGNIYTPQEVLIH